MSLHEKIKITINCWTTTDKKPRKLPQKKKKYFTSKDKEATIRQEERCFHDIVKSKNRWVGDTQTEK